MVRVRILSDMLYRADRHSITCISRLWRIIKIYCDISQYRHSPQGILLNIICAIFAFLWARVTNPMRYPQGLVKRFILILFFAAIGVGI